MRLPDGTYSCNTLVHTLGGQHIHADATIADGRVLVHKGANIAIVPLDGTFAKDRQADVDFCVSATSNKDVTFDSIVGATSFVLGRNASNATAMELWHDRKGIPIGELMNAETDSTTPKEVTICSYTCVPDTLIKTVKSLLRTVDTEFVPALSSRSSTLQSSFAHRPYELGDITAYLDDIRKQPCVLAIKDGRVIGLLSWTVSEDEPGIYVTTVAVHPDNRRQGIARKLYDTMIEEHQASPISTRTWSTDWNHLALLRSLSFEETSRETAHRGPVIDTIHLRREPKTPNDERTLP